MDKKVKALVELIPIFFPTIVIAMILSATNRWSEFGSRPDTPALALAFAADALYMSIRSLIKPGTSPIVNVVTRLVLACLIGSFAAILLSLSVTQEHANAVNIADAPMFLAHESATIGCLYVASAFLAWAARYAAL